MEKEERTAEAAGYEGEITAENLWSVIVSLQGKVFYTSKKLPFTYTVTVSYTHLAILSRRSSTAAA